MAIKALIYGGVQIVNITPPHPRTTYDGVTTELSGMTLTGGTWKNANITLDMSPLEALELASDLIRAADGHGEQTRGHVRCFVKRLAKKQQIKV